jgi:hypothetical protein
MVWFRHRFIQDLLFGLTGRLLTAVPSLLQREGMEDFGQQHQFSIGAEATAVPMDIDAESLKRSGDVGPATEEPAGKLARKEAS